MVGVLALVLDENEHVLLLDHRFRVPWSWGLPGGFVRHGESLTVALRRELQEEMGLEVSVRPQPLDAELTISTHNVSITYVARILGAPIEVRPRDPREIRGGKFFEPGKLPEYIHPRHADIVRSYWRQTSAIV
ncbi:MAG: NUDIX hydrolase [Myxococcales bacterium]|nr:NUDIX hydrolase [Myxococcales bacterium]